MITIPGYTILRTLGKGGMASVYLAIQESFEREVALKVMNPTLSEDPKFSERFLREAKIVSRLVHPNIVTVYDVGVHNNHHFLSMEYIPGKDLKTKRRFLTAKQCIRAIKEVANALDYASKKGYVHRDVKPENIMLHEEDGRAILMDFGIACMADSTSGMTQTGTAIGTPHYMSPEQAKGRPVDARSDIYSLGVVFFLCLTGHVPFDADSAVAVGIKHVSEPTPKLPKYLALLQPIIDKVLAKDPGQRYQTGQELIAAIEQLSDRDLEAIDILATRSTISRIDSHDTEAPTVISSNVQAVNGSVAAPRKTTQVPKPQLKDAGAKTAGNSTAKERKHTTATTSPIRATTGPTRAGKQRGTQSLAATEVLAVDEEDRRDWQPHNKSKRLWPWLAVAGIAGVMAGSYYFKSYLPPPVASVVDDVSAQVLQLKSQWLGQDHAPTPAAIDNSSNSDADAAVAATGPESPATDNSGSVPVDNAVDSEIPSALTSEDEIATAVPPAEETPFNAARTLHEQLEDDISVSPRLAELYRNVLPDDPDYKRAQLGLANLQRWHVDQTQAALQVRDLETAQLYLDSMAATFEDIESAEQYQSLMERFNKAKAAQEFIDQGDRFLEQDVLTNAAGGNALDSFDAALKVDEGNPLAQQGKAQIVNRLAELAGKEYEFGDYQKSLQRATSGLTVDPTDATLLKYKKEATAQIERLSTVEIVLQAAKRAQAEGRLIAPSGDNAFEYYKQLVSLDEAAKAQQGVAEIEQTLSTQIERHISNAQFEEARAMLLEAQEKFPASDRLLSLNVRLEKAIEEDFIARQPKVLNMLVSSAQPNSIAEPQQNPLTLERTVYIGFSYLNFEAGTSVVRAVLYDGSRSVEIAQASVLVNGVEGVKFFQIERPVEGFAPGGYNIDLFLDDKQLATMAFKVEN